MYEIYNSCHFPKAVWKKTSSYCATLIIFKNTVLFPINVSLRLYLLSDLDLWMTL